MVVQALVETRQQELGRQGEDLACGYLEGQGLVRRDPVSPRHTGLVDRSEGRHGEVLLVPGTVASGDAFASQGAQRGARRLLRADGCASGRHGFLVPCPVVRRGPP